MARWQENPRERLTRAALELFAERGYDATTVADIAGRAGLTKSTFFRHFDDKRDVLFGGQQQMISALATVMASAPAEWSPLESIAGALDAWGALFAPELRPSAAARQRVIRADSALRERELLKTTQLTAALVDALRACGTDDLTAHLTARIGMLALEIGYDRWAADTDELTLDDHVRAALRELVDRATDLGADRPGEA